MAVQLTPEQEQRIVAIVEQGAYGSVQEALDAAVGAVELASQGVLDSDLEASLIQGRASRELSEEEFWEQVEESTGHS